MRFDPIDLRKYKALSYEASAYDDYPYKVDGIPVNEELFEFCNAIRVQYRDIKFIAPRREAECLRIDCSQPGEPYDPLTLHREVWMHFPTDVFAFMHVGVSSYKDTKSELFYGVGHRNIRNEKYRPDRKHHHMKLCSTMDKAMRVVRQNMVPYTLKDVASVDITLIDRVVAGKRSDVDVGVRNAATVLFVSDDFRAEVLNLLRTGHVFSSPSVQERAMAWKLALEEAEENKKTPRRVLYIRVNTVDDESTYSFMQGMVSDDPWSSGIMTDDVWVKDGKFEDLPEAAQTRLMALTIAVNGSHVDEVGMRVNDDTFWVYL